MTEPTILTSLLVWSTIAVVLGWLAPAGARTWLIAACGAGLLATNSPLSLAILASAALATFPMRAHFRDNRFLTGTGIVLVAALFAGFMLGSTASGDGIENRILLPLGLAFYALRLIHYLFESYKGALRPHALDDYLAYLFLPSALSVGPIHRFDEFLRDLRRRRWDSAAFSQGTQRALYGLVKIVILGNLVLGEIVGGWLGPVTPQSGLATVYAGAIVFWLKLYVVFGGYSDVAIGFAAMTGFRIRENFDWPVFARNIAEFWQRWHLSLSSWCRDYVFTPVLSATRAPVLAVLVSMIVLGLWHELSLRYLLWGAYHGAGIAAYRGFDRRAGTAIDRLPPWAAIPWRILATLLTLHFVLLSFHVTQALERLIEG